MSESEKLDFLYEWAVWGHLSSKKDIELILLKGHLMLETALEITLSRNNKKNDDYSFYRKITILENDIITNSPGKQFIINSLKEINSMRNKLAHEFFYDDLNTKLEKWSDSILNNLKGKKFSRFTHRTKIIHSFSILTVNLLKIKNDS